MFRYDFIRRAVLLLLAAPLWAAGTEYRAGVASVEITPREPIRLSGYGNRTKPSEGVLAPIHTKALAITRGRGETVVIVTTDLIGLPRAITDMAAARIQQKYGVERAGLLFNSSHTHTGPYVRGNLPLLFEIGAADKAVIDAYAERLTDALVEVTGRALLDLSPARLEVAHGEAHFGVNRRQMSEKGVVIGVNRAGPVDPEVPVLRVTDEDGKVRAVLFGYACHNTTLTGEHNAISGDYAGFAQEAVERANPGATAMFLMLCGGDQNPNPRSTLALAESHGKELADSAEKVLKGDMKTLQGPIKTAFQITELPLQAHTRETFEALQNDTNVYKKRLALAMLKAYDERRPVRSVAYPVQAVRFGKDLTILALGGEVVIDYDLRAKREFPNANLVVAGYSNDVMCYIPSKRVLGEGGYEAVDSMLYYGKPMPFTEEVEERIFTTIHSVMKRVGN